MSVDYTAQVGFGAIATLVDRVDGRSVFDEVDGLNLKYVSVEAFGNYTYEDMAEMGLAVVLSSTISSFDGPSVERLHIDSNYSPEITDEISAELEKLREYFNFDDVSGFGWLIGSYIC